MSVSDNRGRLNFIPFCKFWVLFAWPPILIMRTELRLDVSHTDFKEKVPCCSLPSTWRNSWDFKFRSWRLLLTASYLGIGGRSLRWSPRFPPPTEACPMSSPPPECGLDLWIWWDVTLVIMSHCMSKGFAVAVEVPWLWVNEKGDYPCGRDLIRWALYQRWNIKEMLSCWLGEEQPLGAESGPWSTAGKEIGVSGSGILVIKPQETNAMTTEMNLEVASEFLIRMWPSDTLISALLDPTRGPS